MTVYAKWKIGKIAIDPQCALDFYLLDKDDDFWDELADDEDVVIPGTGCVKCIPASANHTDYYNPSTYFYEEIPEALYKEGCLHTGDGRFFRPFVPESFTVQYSNLPRFTVTWVADIPTRPVVPDDILALASYAESEGLHPGCFGPGYEFGRGSAEEVAAIAQAAADAAALEAIPATDSHSAWECTFIGGTDDGTTSCPGHWICYRAKWSDPDTVQNYWRYKVYIGQFAKATSQATLLPAAEAMTHTWTANYQVHGLYSTPPPKALSDYTEEELVEIFEKFSGSGNLLYGQLSYTPSDCQDLPEISWDEVEWGTNDHNSGTNTIPLSFGEYQTHHVITAQLCPYEARTKRIFDSGWSGGYRAEKYKQDAPYSNLYVWNTEVYLNNGGPEFVPGWGSLDAQGCRTPDNWESEDLTASEEEQQCANCYQFMAGYSNRTYPALGSSITGAWKAYTTFNQNETVTVIVDDALPDPGGGAPNQEPPYMVEYFGVEPTHYLGLGMQNEHYPVTVEGDYPGRDLTSPISLDNFTLGDFLAWPYQVSSRITTGQGINSVVDHEKQKIENVNVNTIKPFFSNYNLVTYGNGVQGLGQDTYGGRNDDGFEINGLTDTVRGNVCLLLDGENSATISYKPIPPKGYDYTYRRYWQSRPQFFGDPSVTTIVSEETLFEVRGVTNGNTTATYTVQGRRFYPASHRGRDF